MSLRSVNPPAKRVLLIGWDGADWKIASPLIDAGEMPQLANLVQHGASGPLASLPPFLSPMLWNSIATGKYADQHGITGFASADPQSGKLRPMQSTQRRCKALWNILGEHGLKTHVVGWFASHPAENVTGVCITEAYPRPVAKGAAWPTPVGSVHPPELADEFAELRVRPEDIAPEIIRLFIPRISEIDLARDRRPDQLAVRLAELYTVHNAAIAALDRDPCDFLGVYYHFIDWICHDFMEFHPPRRPRVNEREFEWYKDVVNSAYRLQDLLLRDLISHAGADSTVVLCSDHGFHSDARRPSRVPLVSAGIAIWHRAQGVVAAAGPGIARDVLIPGASVLDITPTVLHLLGLPAAQDMAGRVIASALAGSAPVRTLPSYETVAGPHPRPRHLHALDESQQHVLLEQFAVLGYVDLTENGVESAADRNERDTRWNLAITLRHAGKNEDAFALLDALHLERPEDPRYAFHLAMCQIHLGLLEEATATAETIVDFTPDNTHAALLLAELATARGDPAAALSLLDDVAPKHHHAPDPALLAQRGSALLNTGRTLEAAAAFRAAADADPENPVAWLGFSRALLDSGHAADAETCARQAIALAPTMALAHLTLGRCLALQNKRRDALHACRRALELNPRLAAARLTLDRLSGKPFSAEIDSFSEELAAPSAALDNLRAASSARRAAHNAKLASLRSASGPVEQFTPPQKLGASRAAAATPDVAQSIVIVSGLPRSGTSLMMQMLAQGGLPPMTDDYRPADENNPEGYLEWEPIKTLPREPDLIAGAVGKAVKVVSPLLPHLPSRYRYKIIFMTRPAAEVARSQEKMRQRLSPVEAATPAAFDMEPLLARHASEHLARLRSAPNIDLLEIDYPALIARPADEARRVAAFLGHERLPRAESMASAVRPELHREKEASR